MDSSDPVENHIAKFDWRFDTTMTEEKRKRMEKHGMKFPSLSFRRPTMESKSWLDGKVPFVCVCVHSSLLLRLLLTVSTFHTTTQVHSGRSSFGL